MGKKKKDKNKNKQNISIFYMECEKWLEENMEDIEAAIRKRLNERIGPIGLRAGTKVYCSEASCSLSVYDIHNPQIEANIKYTLCDEKMSYTLRKVARAGLSSPLNAADIQKRLCKNLSKYLSAAANAVAVGQITEDFLSAEAENLLSDNSALAIESGPGSSESVKQLVAEDIQEAFCGMKTKGSAMRSLEKYLLGVFSGYCMRDAFMDIHVSSEACEGGVQFRAEAEIFFPPLKIPLLSMVLIVPIEDRHLSSGTKEECVNLFEGQAKAGLGKLLKKRLDVFAEKQLFYVDCMDLTPLDPGYRIKILLEQVKNAVIPKPEDMIQVHWKGMDYELEKSALFIGHDGAARVYAEGLRRPVYVGTVTSLSRRFSEDRTHLPVSVPNNRIDPSFPENLFDFTEFITALFQDQPLDLKLVIDMDPLTVKPVSFKIGFAEYRPGQSQWLSSEQIESPGEFKAKVCSEAAFQSKMRSRIINDERLTGTELEILQFLQQHPHRGKMYTLENMSRKELEKEGRKLLFEGRIQKFLIREPGDTYYIHPQYANIPYLKLYPAPYSSEYKHFYKWNAMQRIFERQLASARSQSEYRAALRTLTWTAYKFQAAFLQTEECREFLSKFADKEYVRSCLASMPGGKELEDLIFAEDIENEGL